MRNDIPAPSRRSLLASPRATLGLAEAVNHLLDRGVVLAGDGVVSLGGVDLVYLGLNLVLSSTETLRRHDGGPLPPSPSPRRRGGAGPHPPPLPGGEGANPPRAGDVPAAGLLPPAPDWERGPGGAGLG